MATILHPDGRTEDIGLLDPTDQGVTARLQQIVGGYFEAIALPDGDLLFINEDGIRLNLPPNTQATKLITGLLALKDGVLRGAAVRCTQAEVTDPDEDEEG